MNTGTRHERTKQMHLLSCRYATNARYGARARIQAFTWQKSTASRCFVAGNATSKEAAAAVATSAHGSNLDANQALKSGRTSPSFSINYEHHT